MCKCLPNVHVLWYFVDLLCCYGLVKFLTFAGILCFLLLIVVFCLLVCLASFCCPFLSESVGAAYHPSFS